MVKNLPECGRPKFDPWVGKIRCSGEGNGNPLQYSCLENYMDREAWTATIHGVAKSWTRLSNQHAHTHTHTLDLENSMDRGAWTATVHRVAKSQT